jgi:hypothetical protein
LIKYETKPYEERVKRPPRMVIDRWKRCYEELDFSKNFQAVITGIRGCGKSSLVETLGAMHLKHNHGCGKIIDLFSARDNEGLSWLRNYDLRDNALLVHGDSVKLSCEWEAQKISQLKLKDFADHKTIISVPAFYANLREEWHGIAKMTQLLWSRTHWDYPWFVAVREATSLLYSRVGIGENQVQARNMFIYAIREFRHSGMAVALDALRLYGLDIEVRNLSDYLFIKACGMFGIPNDLRWMFRYYDLFVDLMKMPDWCFILTTQSGGLCHGRFCMPYWHKTEKEDLLSLLNIDVKYGENINYAEGEQNHVSDFEHVDVMKVRTQKGLSMNSLAKGGTFEVGDSQIVLEKRSSQTIYQMIKQHDADIKAMGYCSVCERLQEDKLARTLASKKTL